MFVPSTRYHQSCRKECKAYLPDTFGLLCWNVHKNNKNGKFSDYLEREIKKKDIDLLVFQEASFKNDEACTLATFSYDAAANLEIKGKFYGVLTASRVQSSYAQAYLSEGQEAFVGPHKSMLLTSYQFKDHDKLLVLNIHAINFRENNRYNKELERFFDFIEMYEGALLIAGDFNSWNKKRLEKLHENVNKLKLKVVSFDTQSDVKSFRGNHLDFIFYKGLELIDASVEKAGKHSDHNPLLAKFKKI
jgi:endonuclease/exonuclease/phosphatase (EEP) superfamily protein YafD